MRRLVKITLIARTRDIPKSLSLVDIACRLNRKGSHRRSLNRKKDLGKSLQR